MVTSMRTTTFLRTALDNSAIVSAVSSGDWDLVVLQGQEISQSHTIDYSTAEAVALAHMAESAGAQALFFAEWSRRGVDETEYIENIYANIAERSDAAVIPVGRSWDRLLADRSNYELWAVDGNHAASDGALLAAATIAFFIAGPDAPITTTGDDHRLLLEAARLTIEDLD